MAGWQESALGPARTSLKGFAGVKGVSSRDLEQAWPNSYPARGQRVWESSLAPGPEGRAADCCRRSHAGLCYDGAWQAFFPPSVGLWIFPHLPPAASSGGMSRLAGGGAGAHPRETNVSRMNRPRLDRRGKEWGFEVTRKARSHGQLPRAAMDFPPAPASPFEERNFIARSAQGRQAS